MQTNYPSLTKTKTGRNRYKASAIRSDFLSSADSYVLAEAFERALVEKDKDTIKKIQKEEKKRARRLTRRRFFESVLAILLILGLGAFAFLMIYPQAELSEIARDNSDLKDEITKVKREIALAEEQAEVNQNLDAIRARAAAIGLKDADENQIVYLPVPNSDSLKTFMTPHSDEIDPEALKDAEDALEHYYQTKDRER